MELKIVTEIENMLVWLDGEISKHEGRMSKPGVKSYLGGWLSAPNSHKHRNDYAGCLAEREFFLKLKNSALCRERKLDDSGA